ncbi:MAG: hypothetical protein IE928_01830 [Gammaproteobacteria bacterium]|nr:hypothetical protein [Gammaproteobacteria bacterium]
MLIKNLFEQIPFPELVFLHFVFSFLLAILFYFIIKKYYNKQCNRLSVFMFFWAVGFFLSELVLFFYYIVVVLSFYFPYRKKVKIKFEKLSNPEFDIHTKSKLSFGGLAGAKERLQNNHLSAQVRVDSLMMLQHFSKSHVTEVVNKLLSDEHDDLRLLAFGMLNKREKIINQQIYEQLEILENIENSSDVSAKRTDSRKFLLMRLAELYWSYIYENLVQGDLRVFSLKMAEHYLQEVLVIEQYRNSSSVFLFAKIKNAQGKYEQALTYFNLSIELGHAPIRVIPYMAEIYFRQRQYEKVKFNMHQLVQAKVEMPSIKGLMGIWVTEPHKSGDNSTI